MEGYDQIPDKKRCPKCGAGPVEPVNKPNRYVCYDCGRVFDGDRPDDLIHVEKDP